MVDLDDDAVVALHSVVLLGVLDDLGAGLSGDLVVGVADLDGHGAQVADLGEVGVTDGAIGLLDGGDHTRGALGALANLVRPVLGQVVGPGVRSLILEVGDEVLGGARLVGTVNHGDRGVRQGQVLVLIGDGRIVPLGDLAVENLGDGVSIHVDVLASVGDTLEVEDHGDRGDVDRHVESSAIGAHGLGLLDLVIGEGLVGTGPCGGTGQEGLHASARTGRVVGDLGVRVGALEAGNPSFDGGLLGGSASALEVTGNRSGLGSGISGGAVGRGSGVIAAGGHGSKHHNAGQGGNGANEDVLLHDYFLIPLSTIRGRLLLPGQLMTTTRLLVVLGSRNRNQ